MTPFLNMSKEYEGESSLWEDVDAVVKSVPSSPKSHACNFEWVSEVLKNSDDKDKDSLRLSKSELNISAEEDEGEQQEAQDHISEHDELPFYHRQVQSAPVSGHTTPFTFPHKSNRTLLTEAAMKLFHEKAFDSVPVRSKPAAHSPEVPVEDTTKATSGSSPVPSGVSSMGGASASVATASADTSVRPSVLPASQQQSLPEAKSTPSLPKYNHNCFAQQQFNGQQPFYWSTNEANRRQNKSLPIPLVQNPVQYSVPSQLIWVHPNGLVSSAPKPSDNQNLPFSANPTQLYAYQQLLAAQRGTDANALLVDPRVSLAANATASPQSHVPVTSFSKDINALSAAYAQSLYISKLAEFQKANTASSTSPNPKESVLPDTEKTNKSEIVDGSEKSEQNIVPKAAAGEDTLKAASYPISHLGSGQQSQGLFQVPLPLHPMYSGATAQQLQLMLAANPYGLPLSAGPLSLPPALASANALNNLGIFGPGLSVYNKYSKVAAARERNRCQVEEATKLLEQERHAPFVFEVEFKHNRRMFFLGPRTPLHIDLGDYVMVEADRGTDLGFVNEVYPKDAFSPRLINSLAKRIVRLALETEVKDLTVKYVDEIKCLQVIKTMVARKKLPMEVVDCEYQFDRKKLSFYFESNHRIDFRDLVKELFKLYKTRIWLRGCDHNEDKNAIDEEKVAAYHQMASA
eukprot:GCRY01003094.1.p1 GENE.GCRY01003094.1~~GCRY01003094.1.p1  ORF type:complete len:688 (+),score=126.58 GCRY01003094.1:262-2325(+)